jgi:hypothetical protein
MGQIRKKKTIGIIGSDDEEQISYCVECRNLGVLSILQDRIYPPDEPIPHDHELWKQCYECGQIVPVYEAKKESRLEDFVETSDNPFDQGKSISGLNNKPSKTRIQKQRQKLLERIEQEKDEDIKRELRKGNTVEIISDSY